MSVRYNPGDPLPGEGEGSRTAADGTPFAVDVTRDRRARGTAAVFVAGPLIWSAHFLLVYLVAEAGCTGDGPGLSLLDPPAPKVVTLVATAVAAAAALACARLTWRRWRASSGEPAADDAADLAGTFGEFDRGGTLAFVSVLLSMLSVVTVLFVGLPAVVLPSC
jgi:hypothetical protein